MANDTIPTPSTTAKGFDPEPLDYVCDMEEPLREVYDLLTGLIYLGQTLSDGGAAASTIADLARDKCEKVQALRAALFHDLHPNAEARA